MADNDGYLPPPKGFATAAIHTAQNPDQWECLSVVPPLVLSSTFKHLSPGNIKQYEYGRYGNPSRDILEQCLAKLEGAKYGLCFSSGVTAISAVFGMFKPGDHMVCADAIYGGTYALFTEVARPIGITTTFVDVTELSNIEKAITPSTKLIWIETPTNPTLTVLDLKAISQIAKKHKVLFTVDNTFLSPYFQRPLEFGADIVVHSLTKYINGHCDVIMGAVVFNDPEIYNKLNFTQRTVGCVPSPFDCFQVIRSLKTLAIRMKQHSANSLVVAKFLESHPKVEKVNHPGLPSHPQHELSKKQTSGHSGMVTFYIKGGQEECKKLLGALKIITLAHSLGGYESLAEYPWLMSHGMVPEDERKAMNISQNLIRLSIGLEDVEDLVDDLKQALTVI